MKHENDFSMMNHNENELNYTITGDKSSKRKTFFIQKLPKLVGNIQNKTFDETINDSDNLEGERIEQKYHTYLHIRYLY